MWNLFAAGGPDDADAPAIEIVRPNGTGPVRTPLTIEIRFRARAGASIDPDSFRASYGLLGFDITDMILQYAQISATGLRAENVAVPPGDYRITVLIADSRSRVGRKTLQITVM